MKKKLILLLIFLLIILINLNSYAFEYTDINYVTMSTLTTDNIGDFLKTFNNYICAVYGTCPYYFISHDSNYYYIMNSTTPFYWKDNYNFGAQIIDNDSYYGLPSNKTRYYLWKVGESGASLSTSSNLSQGANIWYQGVKTDYFTNYDVYNDITQQNEFTKNFDLQNSSEEGSSIDMTETNSILTENFSLIKAFLFLICLYLLCKVLYGVIWWLYNKTLL